MMATLTVLNFNNAPQKNEEEEEIRQWWWQMSLVIWIVRHGKQQEEANEIKTGELCSVN